MDEYGGGLDDSLRHSPVQLIEEDIVSMSTLLVNGKYEDCSVVGLNPFCQLNPVPEVRMPLFISCVFLQPYCFNTFLTLYLVFTCLQANFDFWKVKYDHEAVKKAKAAAINAKKTTRRSKRRKRVLLKT